MYLWNFFSMQFDLYKRVKKLHCPILQFQIQQHALTSISYKKLFIELLSLKEV
jgi:hypothetical protein